jgi:hypothetical protein
MFHVERWSVPRSSRHRGEGVPRGTPWTGALRRFHVERHRSVGAQTPFAEGVLWGGDLGRHTRRPQPSSARRRSVNAPNADTGSSRPQRGPVRPIFSASQQPRDSSPSPMGHGGGCCPPGAGAARWGSTWNLRRREAHTVLSGRARSTWNDDAQAHAESEAPHLSSRGSAPVQLRRGRRRTPIAGRGHRLIGGLQRHGRCQYRRRSTWNLRTNSLGRTPLWP